VESIFSAGTKLADLTVSNIAAQRGLGVYRLSFTFDLLIYVPSATGEDLSMTLSADLNFGTATTAAYLGHLDLINTPLLIAAARPRPTYEHPVLYVDLTRHQLEAIESMRLGQSLRADMSLLGLVLGGKDAIRIQQSLSIPIAQSDWLVMLDQWRFGKYLLLEVPVPKDTPSDLSQALTSISKAEAAIRNGEYRTSVGLARDALDSLNVKLGPVHLDSVFLPLFQKAATLDKRGRLDLLRRALWFMTSAAHHADNVTTAFDWNRQDAVAILAMIVALLQMEG